VRSGELVRLRRGHYCLPGTPSDIQRAVRVGGPLTCVSALRHYGVWVDDDPFLHIAVPSDASRLRTPRNRRTPLTRENRDECELHWNDDSFSDGGSEFSVGLLQALFVAVLCRPRALALAALDSAAHLGLLDEGEIVELRSAFPRRLKSLVDLIEPRCASGIESVLRLALVEAGLRFEVQVPLRGVGIVDFVVEGCVVVETDGRAWHSGVDSQARDYRRDIAAIRLGFAVVRANYQQVLFDIGGVMDAILAAVAHHVGR
jgi:very-short-patch-repair endonuclease